MTKAIFLGKRLAKDNEYTCIMLEILRKVWNFVKEQTMAIWWKNSLRMIPCSKVTLQILLRSMLFWKCPIFNIKRRRRKIWLHYHKWGIWYARYSIYHLLEFVYIRHLGILHFSKFFFIFILSIIPTEVHFINDLIIRSSTNSKFLFSLISYLLRWRDK